jgi:hypothetical protein
MSIFEEHQVSETRQHHSAQWSGLPEVLFRPIGVPSSLAQSLNCGGEFHFVLFSSAPQLLDCGKRIL